MNHSQFLELCRDISIELNLDDLDELGLSNYVEIDDIPIAFIFDEHSNPDRIFCYVDLGPIDDSLRLDIYDNLLTLNLLSGVKTNGVYALDPTSGHVLFVIHVVNLDQVDAEVIANDLRSYSARAISLQNNVFNGVAAAPIAEIVNQLFGQPKHTPLNELA
ncbi:MAG: CesT family type III secretion system chaperone [Oxalobacteraceae bacterium]|jgi:hypothetical protein|nr:CesT family type III secretion system chaperone [Oxalobacteraceae bacterium]